MEKQLRKTAENFLTSHREAPVSAAKIELMLYHDADFVNHLNRFLTERSKLSPEDQEIIADIENATEPAALIRLMKMQLKGFNRTILRRKILAMEDVLAESIKEKVLRYRQDYFVENSVYFFLLAKENYTEWIYNHYSEIRCEYMKCMLCLVLGVRGNETYLPFLMNEAERFLKEYPNESFDQGPYLAVKELIENLDYSH